MKKGQAALEFLTTYGWAFLVVLVMIGALAYFGVLNPSRLLPDKCVFGAGIGGCTDWGVSTLPAPTNSVQAQIINNYGKSFNLGATFSYTIIGTICPIGDRTISVTYGGVTDVSASGIQTVTTSAAWDADQPLTVSVLCDGIPVTSKFQSGERPKITITFTGTQSGSSYVTSNQGVLSLRIP